MDERERQYQEYLALRQQKQEEEIERGKTTHPNYRSVTDTPYGASEFRRKQQEKALRDREMAAYLEAREADRNRRGVRSGVRNDQNRERVDSFDTQDYEEYRTSYKMRSANKRKAEKQAEKAQMKAQKRARKKKRKMPKKSMARNSAYEKTMAASERMMVKLDKRGRTKGKKKLRIAIVIIATLVVALTAAVAIMLIMGLSALASIKDIDIDENNLGISPAVGSQLENYTNIAVLGIDARADEDDSNSRSDAIIVASINEDTNEVKLFSVYRDTLLDVGDEGLDKITHAYFYGGAQQSVRALNRNLDMNIEDVVVINWKTVADTIDAVGGIEIEVQESEIEEMNKYIPNTAKNVDGSDTLIEAPGKQRLNGVQAVTYSRIRKDAATGDYRRNERMKIVFSETFKEVRGAGFFKMFNVARNIAPELRTDMSAGDILGLMIRYKSFEMTDDSTGFPYEVGSWTGNGAAGYAWYGPPVNLSDNVSRLHQQFFDQQYYVPTDTVQQISEDISYKTGIY
ncbi:MAG: LCP family protein [Eubacteriales bacterium]|nr:LCP family protein [Eubacteriales bacterium]